MLHAVTDEDAIFGVETDIVSRRDRLEPCDDLGISLGAHDADRGRRTRRPPGRPLYRRHLLDDTYFDDNITRFKAPATWAPEPVRKPAPATHVAAADRDSSHATLSRTATFAHAP